MVTATWNGVVIARSDRTEVVEGNHYFPLDDVDRTLLEPSDTTSHCPWKGEASYYSVNAGGATNTDAAWTYHDPSEAARQIIDRVAFWHGVDVSDDAPPAGR